MAAGERSGLFAMGVGNPEPWAGPWAGHRPHQDAGGHRPRRGGRRGRTGRRAAGGLPGVPTLPTFTAASRVPPGRAPQAATGGDAPSAPGESQVRTRFGPPSWCWRRRRVLNRIAGGD